MKEDISKKTCEACGGSGQLSSFLGVSRFLLSWEECCECCGLGYIADESEGGQDQGAKSKKKQT